MISRIEGFLSTKMVIYMRISIPLCFHHREQVRSRQTNEQVGQAPSPRLLQLTGKGHASRRQTGPFTSLPLAAFGMDPFPPVRGFRLYPDAGDAIASRIFFRFVQAWGSRLLKEDLSRRSSRAGESVYKICRLLPGDCITRSRILPTREANFPLLRCLGRGREIFRSHPIFPPSISTTRSARATASSTS